MLHSRVLRPGIVTNEVLAGLGPEATLLFERLWMLADREGRLEDRPDRIRAEAFPYWPSFPVENLLEKLAEKGFILRYSVHAVSCIFLPKFAAHQPIHPHERKSTIPPPTRSALRSVGLNGNEKVRNVITCPDMSRNVSCLLPLPLPIDKIPIGVEGGCRGEDSEPPPPPPENGRPERKPPGTEHPPASRQEGPQQADLSLMKESLDALGKEVGLPPPDAAMVRHILESGQGASPREVHAVLVGLYKRHRFREIRSWGLVPLVVAQCFAA